MSAPDRSGRDARPADPAIRALDAVSCQLGDVRVLREVTLDLREGETTCLLGPSGCGKSTLLRVAAGLLPASAGTVRIDPADCALVFQNARLLPWLTVAENLGLALHGRPRRLRRQAIADALAQVYLPGTEKLLPSQLSGGMAQRVGIARALLRQPRILLMDEPFAALDAITRAGLQDAVRALIAARGATCLFVTHDVDEAMRMGRRILVMRAGAIACEFDAAASGEPDLKAAILRELDRDAPARPNTPGSGSP